MNKKSIFKEVKELVTIALALLIYALAWQLFIFPHQFTAGGATGVCSIIMYATQGLLPQGLQDFFASMGMFSINGGIPVSVSYLAINAIFLILSVKILGLQFSLRTIYGVIVVTMYLWIPWEEVFIYLTGEPFPVFDPFMSCIIAGLMMGLSLGITFCNNGSSGGTDIIAKIINKYRDITLGRALTFCDVVIISCSGILPNNGIEQIVYGLITMFISFTTVDMYINGVRQSVQFFIFSQKAEEIADAIQQKAKRGVTLFDATGWYSKKPMKVVTVLVRKTESHEIFKIINEIDDNAFISQSAAIGVYGSGFDPISKKNK